MLSLQRPCGPFDRAGCIAGRSGKVLIGVHQRRNSSAAPTRLCACACVLSLALALNLPLSLHAQENDPPSEQTSGEVDSLARERDQTGDELDALSEEIRLSQDRQEALENEVARLEHDTETIRTNLIATANRQRALSEEIEALEARFIKLRDEEATIQSSLTERRDVLAEVLAGLQRLGRNPPPALLVSADDALASVRSAILLGSVVPEMREETEKLIADLSKLKTVRGQIDEQREMLVSAHAAQAEQEERLSLLMGEKRALQAERGEALAREREEAEELAARATNLQELIFSLESEISSVREAAEEARRATRLREEREAEQLARARALAESDEPDAARITPSLPFEALKGKLRLPAEGRIAQTFGADDGTGHDLNGAVLATRSGAVVQAPMDAWVVYAGPFRTYGQLLILNAGDDYHVVLAGMDRIDVTPGQFVVAGEPVAEMGETRLAGAAALALASSQPSLYIEFRKDGQPVDPAPWWAS